MAENKTPEENRNTNEEFVVKEEKSASESNSMKLNDSNKKFRSVQKKQMTAMFGITLITLIVLIPSLSILYRKQMEGWYADKAFSQASIAAQMIDGDTIQRYRETGEKDAYYEEIDRMLLVMKQEEGFDYLYVVIPYEEEQYYIWDAGVEGEEGVCELGDTDIYYDDGKEVMMGAFRKDAPRTILITNSKDYGYLASAYVPIMDSKGEPAALASVDLSMVKINKQIRSFVALILILVGGVFIICQSFYYVYLRRKLVKPLNILHREVSGLVEDNMQGLNDFHADIHTGDEIEVISDAFEKVTKELVRYIDHVARVTKEKERIGAELELATKIQANMLPNIFPAFPERSEFDIFASMTPAKEVGGDFYDFFMLDDDHLGMVIADVSGKGVPAALFMMMSKILVSNYASIGGTPAEVLYKVNDQICKNNEEDMFVTVWFGILTLSTGHVIAANAGHEFPVLKKANGEYELFKDKHGFVVGGMEGARYKDYEFDLEKGGMIFVYTDGVPEATNADEEMYGTDRLLAALNKIGDATPQEVLEGVHADVNAFVGDAPQFDDLTMLAVKLL